MTMVPIEDARARLSTLAVEAGDDPREVQRAVDEQARVVGVLRRRRYYGGEQYDSQNRNTAQAERVADVAELPEHLKKHAYSTQIQESVDFIAAQLAETFRVKAKATDVQEVLMKVLTSSPDLAAGDDEDDLSVTNVVRDALQAGDTPVYVRWDAVEQTAWFEFWESEAVEFQYAEENRHRLEKVIVTEMVWVALGESLVEKVQATTYEMQGGECSRSVTLDGDPDEMRPVEYLGLPFIPWRLLRGNKKKIRGTRGESIITSQAMAAADRYNGVEQTSFLIARYNSHGNLAVIGDAASLKAEAEGSIRKDVADVLTFPGGTGVIPIVLPTDPKMIEHQREVLLDSLFGTFGLTRLDQSTIEGMGQVSGYALEILNRKSDGTFSQIGKQWMRDMRAVLNMALDVTAYKDSEPEDLAGVTGDEGDGMALAEPMDPAEMEVLSAAVLERMREIDPDARFPDRKIGISLGTGYIVDEVMIREDFTAGLISIEEALRQRGRSDEDIKRILRELKAAKPKDPEVSLTPEALAAAQAALTVGTAGQPTGADPGIGTQAGSTLGKVDPTTKESTDG